MLVFPKLNTISAFPAYFPPKKIIFDRFQQNLTEKSLWTFFFEFSVYLAKSIELLLLPLLFFFFFLSFSNTCL